jgi:hypothetical protein
MKRIRHRLAAPVALFLIFALCGTNLAFARSKPLDAAEVHARVIKRGVNGFLVVKEDNGIQLAGKILSIDDRSFSLLLVSESQPTVISYADVTDIRNGATTHAGIIVFALVAGTGVAAVIALAVHFHNSQPKLDTSGMPALP